MADDGINLSEMDIREVYEWVDQFALSRVKKNISRDFADGVLMAEILKESHSDLVPLHSITAVNARAEKINNWLFLRKKVFHKIGFELTNQEIEGIADAKESHIEKILFRLKRHIESASKFAESSSGVLKGSREAAKNRIENIRKGGVPVIEESDTEKGRLARTLRETVNLLETKVGKLELLAKVKDDRIKALMSKLNEAGVDF